MASALLVPVCRTPRRCLSAGGSPTDGEVRTTESQSAPLPVMLVQDNSPFQLAKVWSVLGPAIAPFVAAGLTIVLIIFMLIRREDLRDRAISLVGSGHLSITTKALDEAGERISRYLLTQLAINASYGLAIAAGLSLIGLPYPLLWGLLTAL